MTMFLDCEFNGHKGELISMAIVSNDDTCEPFYEVLCIPHDTKINDWVLANVIPVLEKPSIHLFEFRTRLHAYLLKHEGETIIADSPADFAYMMDVMHWLHSTVYYMLEVEVSMKLIRSGEIKPKIPHNALSDAIALKEWFYGDRRYGA